MLNDIARIYDESNSEGGFSRFNAQVTRLQSLDQIAAGWVLQTMVRSQYAPENLESSEKMPLGGPSGVRAYPQGEAAGDRAALVSVELRRGFSWVSGWSNWMSLFYDAGRSQIHAKPFDGSDNVRSLRGYGLGMGADYSGKYFVSASVAKPVGDEPLDGVEAGRSVRGWIQVGANY
jgi:hemolysin activation/secretion protein